MSESWDIATRREWYLFNPGPAFSFTYGNTEEFNFPAHNEHWTDPSTGEKYPEAGVLPIRPRGYQREYDMRTVPPSPLRVPHVAEDIIRYFIGNDFKSGHLGKTRGIRRLSPSDAKNAEYDERMKQEARTAFLQERYEQAQRNIARFKADNAKLVAEGKQPFAANKLILDDYKFVEDYAANATVGIAKFQCPECFTRFASLKGVGSLEEHANELHKAQAEEIVRAASGEPAKKKPGRPRKQAVAA